MQRDLRTRHHAARRGSSQHAMQMTGGVVLLPEMTMVHGTCES